MTRIRYGLACSVAVSVGTCVAVALAAPPPAAPVAAKPPNPKPAPPKPADAKPADAKPAAAAGGNLVTVTVANPSAFARARETIALPGSELVKLAPSFELKKALLIDAGGRPVLSQLVDMNGDDEPDELVFQADFAPGEAKRFNVRLGQRHPAAPAEYKAYGRFVRERHDDFVWENDLVAHRMYGPDLETWAKDPLVSSGIDTWAKRVPKLVVNEWYMTDDYHQDSGQGADFYGVGKSRGCGGPRRVGRWQVVLFAQLHSFAGARKRPHPPGFRALLCALGRTGRRAHQ